MQDTKYKTSLCKFHKIVWLLAVPVGKWSDRFFFFTPIILWKSMDWIQIAWDSGRTLCLGSTTIPSTPLNTDILRIVYCAYFHPIIQYGIIFGGNSAHAQQVFKLQKRVVRVMSGMGPRSSCRNLFKKLNILPVPCQYILSLMLFIIDNQQDFFTNADVHGLNTRNKNYLYLPVQSLTCVQKWVSCSGVKTFNSLPSDMQSYKGDRKKCKKILCKYLAIHSFYSITEFLECKTNKNA
jgi:hypothetical protein